MTTYSFQVEVQGDVIFSDGPKPIYDENSLNLVGAFNLNSNNTVQCFVAGVGHPTALNISNDAPFYFTPKINEKTGKIESAVVSDISVGYTSVAVFKTEKHES